MFWSWFRRQCWEEKLDGELRFHIEQQIQEHVRSGDTPEEARRKALIEFGGLDQIKEECRETRPVAFCDTILQDLRYALRQMKRNPGFAAVVILTLALGIGATTSIFTVVDTVLLHPLPYNDSSRLAAIFSANPRFGDIPRMADSFADVREIRSQARSFELSAYYYPYSMNLSGREEPVRVRTTQVSEDFFDVFGAKPALGRFFTPSEEIQGNGNVVVLSSDFWKSHFGQRQNVIGDVLTLDEKAYTIVGVASSAFGFPDSGARAGTQIWLPVQPPAKWPTSPHYGSELPVYMLVRLRPGVSLQAANTELAVITARIRKGAPSYDQDWTLHAIDLNESIVGRVRPALLVLLAGVALVLLIACANVASLMLSRGWQRQKEIAIRLALGATTKRVARQLLTESLVLAAAAGVIGLVFAFWGVGAFALFAPQDTPRLSELRPDWTLIWFTSLAALVVGFLFGLAPALQASQLNPNVRLKENVAANAGTRPHKLRNAIVIAEMALALPLVVGSVLLAESLYNMTNTPTGMRTDHLLTMHLAVPVAKYSDRSEIQSLIQPVLTKIRELPMVESAAVGDISILGGEYGMASHVFVEGNETTSQGVGNIVQIAVTADYFKTVGVPLLKGRVFTEQDGFDGPPVAIVNRKLQQLLLPDRDPIGTRMSFKVDKQGQPVWLTVVGVVANTRDTRPDSEIQPAFFVPYYQWSFPGTVVLVRTRTDPSSAAADVQRQIWSVDKRLPVTGVATVDEIVYRATAQPRFRALLLAVFAFLGFFLAILGIYGVVSYSVAHRTHEIGIRMALGAEYRDILKLIVGQGVRLALLGIVIGLASCLFLTRLLSSLLFGVSPTDATTFLLVAPPLISIAVLASYIPARRAARLDPMQALRTE